MQIEVPQIDPTLWKRVNIEAKHRGTSATELLQEALYQYLGIKPIQPQPHDSSNLRRLAGTWSKEEAEEFESNIEWTTRIDEDMWT